MTVIKPLSGEASALQTTAWAEVEKRQDEFIDLLAEAVAIRSVSTWLDHRPEVVRMANWLKTQIEGLGGTAEFRQPPLPDQTDGKISAAISPVVLGVLGSDPKKKTLLIYGHYDVQPAEMGDGWSSDPWTLTRLPEVDELRGRGSTDDKGPVVGWLCALQCFKTLGKECPVNVRFILEGMEESGSIGFDALANQMHAAGDAFFKGIDYACVSDNYWLTTKKPCITHGLRGLVSVNVEIQGSSLDLHSGIYGGQTYEPMDDLFALFAQLKDREGVIAVPGLFNQVAPTTAAENLRYDKIEFSVADKKTELGVSKIRYEDDKTACLQSVWRNPSLTIHGIEGAFSTSGFKTVIPHKVTGKFSVRIVPDMDIETTQAVIKTYLDAKFAERHSPNKMTVTMDGGRWWHVDPDQSVVFKVGIAALETVFGVSPDLTREGGSIPIVFTLTEVTGKDVCLIPMGRVDDRAHSQNEKLDVSNYVKGMKTFITFLLLLAEVKEEVKEEKQ